MFLNKKNKNKRGFMTVEVLISAFILTISLLATFNITHRAMILSGHTFNQYKATLLLEEGVEAVKVVRSLGWDNISSLVIGNNFYLEFDESASEWTLSSDSALIDGKFTRTVSFDNAYRNSMTDDISKTGVLDEDIRIVSVNVSWSDGGNTYDKQMRFYLLNIYE